MGAQDSSTGCLWAPIRFSNGSVSGRGNADWVLEWVLARRMGGLWKRGMLDGCLSGSVLGEHRVGIRRCGSSLDQEWEHGSRSLGRFVSRELMASMR